jgi:hypothetical protein
VTIKNLAGSRFTKGQSASLLDCTPWLIFLWITAGRNAFPEGTHRFGPWRSLSGLAAQLHRPVQHLLKGHAEGPAALLKLLSIDRSKGRGL